ncbi:uncharacterized protein PG998_012546 [Apiospora kogelbergensis]|uniref:uncharacterized protein n=1 Tax=Apiospora kogelbergensis TaxID=1337665 RepID=UPI00312D92DC
MRKSRAGFVPSQGAYKVPPKVAGASLTEGLRLELASFGRTAPRPPYWWWRGRHTAEMRLLLPVGILDGAIKKMSRLDLLGQKVDEKKGLKQD